MGQTTLWAHATVLAAGAVSASQARDFVGTHLVEHDLWHLVDDVRLVVSELATNALAHAGTPFTVRLLGEAGVVLLTVQDGSHTLPSPVTAEVLDTNGRGLMIVDVVSRAWGVEMGSDGVKSVWARFDA